MIGQQKFGESIFTFMRIHYVILSLLFVLVGCAAPPETTGSLGYENSRRVVIVGENVDPNLAVYYEKKYDALVWFTPYKGRLVKNTDNFFQSGLGPSVAMRSLIRELESINYSLGEWQIIIPKIAEDYFLAALKNMKDHSLSKARGLVVLIDSTSNKDIEAQLKRVTDDNFFVSYEFHKKNAP